MTSSTSLTISTSGSLSSNSELSIRSPSNSEHTSSDELQPKKEILIYQNQLKEQQRLKKLEEMKEDQLEPKHKVNKWLILFLVFLLPISLFICFTTRFNAISGLYFLLFIIYLFVPNHSYTRGVKKFQNFHFAYLTIVVIFSSLVLIGQIVFNSYLYHNEKNGNTIIEENSDTYEIFETIGLKMVWLNAIDGFLAIFPDACLLIISIVTLILFKKDHNIIKSKNLFKSKRGINLPKNTRTTKIFISLALIFFIAVTSPCVGNLVFLVFGVIFFSIWSFGSIKIYDFKLYWVLLFLYSVAYFLLIYIFQFPSFDVDIPDYIGVFYIVDPVMVVYLPIFRIIILFLTILSISSVLTDQFFGEDVHKKKPKHRTIINQASIGRTSLFLFVLSICLLLFYVSLSPSLLTLPIWILCGVSILFPKVFTFLISITSHYIILIFLAQYIFNIDFGFTSTDILSDLGFLFFEDPIITFGLGGLTVVFLCFHNRLINFLKKSSNLSDKDQNGNSENEKLINNASNSNDNSQSTSTDSLEEENEWLELDDIRDKDDDDDDDDDELKKKRKKKKKKDKFGI